MFCLTVRPACCFCLFPAVVSEEVLALRVAPRGCPHLRAPLRFAWEGQGRPPQGFVTPAAHPCCPPPPTNPRGQPPRWGTRRHARCMPPGCMHVACTPPRPSTTPVAGVWSEGSRTGNAPGVVRHHPEPSLDAECANPTPRRGDGGPAPSQPPPAQCDVALMGDTAR